MPYDGETKKKAEANFLAKCHRTKKLNSIAERILDQESFFDTTGRPDSDKWLAFREAEWEEDGNTVKGSEIQSALRDYLAEIQKKRCCYCANPLLPGGHSRPLDHILSRAKFPKFSLHFWNLTVACSRCNGIKSAVGGDEISKGLLAYPKPAQFTRTYHPRFHAYDQHIKFITAADNSFRFDAYVGKTAQGRNLVENLLGRVAHELALESNDPDIAKDMQVIREELLLLDETAAVNKVEEFQRAFRDAITTQATKC